ncbi:uncharacterized protein BYT42DRAFT_498260 [Radiomyces spectabilis]|uniref:uncharacterized protein n=1 Tax=Radiomyces spectabilis TaxID=64574 RepID=UPI002220C16E|nr:uncharacterized protein BYT42DRAFT_498260 [Radiomyces spectabilis]KAI8376255.1 hypothetical protein BYT42DRAFT_498260 [Radiomyces spectabilis]
MHRHRPGSLHQSNKPFKSRHASKGTLKEISKGKVNRVSVKQPGSKNLSKVDRRYAAKVLQQKKREEITRVNRIFEGRHGAPKIVPVLPLCPDSDVEDAIAALYKTLGVEPPVKGQASVLNVERFKQKLQLVPLRRNFIDVMDAFKVADFAIILMSAEVEVDQFGINCLLGVLNQGLVKVIPVVQHLNSVSPKLAPSVKKSLVSFTQQFFPEEEHLYSLDNDNEALNVLRHITSQRPKPLAWRDLHPYMLADNVEYEPDNEETGTLKVTGFARGNPFNANRLVHLQNFGDFQLQQITTSPLQARAGDMQEDAEIVDTPNPAEQDDLVAENEPDFMENEQTWPTEEELAEAEERVRQMRSQEGKQTKRVPKGTSAYQAAWIVDEEDEEYSEYEDDDEEEMVDADIGTMDDGDDVEPAEGMSSFPDDDEYEEIEMEGKNNDDDEFDAEEEARQYEEYLKSRQKEFENHKEFPDEIDTPMHIAARERFARYRGLQSFRTSPWDPYENLPIDYARIFQFENYLRTKSRVVSQAIVGNVKPGNRITLWIKNVPKGAYEMYDVERPYIVFGLLQYEHKMSLLNFQITRDNAYEEPVRSKDPMVLHVGFRRYAVRPIYSQNTNKSTNNVHKFERFLRMGRSSIATVYGPVVFGKVPCMFYKETDDINEPILVSTGTFVNTNVKRIVAKRIILSGHPFRVHKRSAVVRYMFFNPDDVHWFKPVQLVTKYGRVGHIRESLGTHGYMKCIFDGALTQQDTVMMYLYKRMYPKWNTELWRGGLDKSTKAITYVKPEAMDME